MSEPESTERHPTPTSFITLYEEDGEVLVRAGAASIAEVLTLAAPCSVSMVIREPDAVAFRLRLSTLTLTDEALIPCPVPSCEQRGAWLRVLPIAEQVIRALQRFSLPEDSSIEHWWLWRIVLGRWHSLTRQSACAALDQAESTAGDAIVLLRGAPEPLRRLILASATAHTPFPGER